jgi:hypothetical protein
VSTLSTIVASPQTPTRASVAAIRRAVFTRHLAAGIPALHPEHIRGVLPTWLIQNDPYPRSSLPAIGFFAGTATRCTGHASHINYSNIF